MIVKQAELGKIRKDNKDKTIVIGLGSFDMFHWEHLQFIKDSKKHGDILVIAVKTDSSVATKAKGRPIINEDQRLEIVDSIKEVDYTVLADEFIDIRLLKEKYNICSHVQELEWWKIFYTIFEELKPDIFVHEPDHPSQKSREIYLKENGIEEVKRDYRGIITTSKIINKILTNDR